MLVQAVSKFGMVETVAGEIANCLLWVAADPTIDSNKPFTVIIRNPLFFESIYSNKEEEKETSVSEKTSEITSRTSATEQDEDLKSVD